MKTNTIVSHEELQHVINVCKVCHIAMVDKDNMPYVLPFNFAYKNETLFLHCGREGRKNEVLKQNPNICVAFTVEKEMYVQNEEIACSYSMLFESVLLFGKVEEVDNFEEKKEILHHIMQKYTANVNYSFAKPSVENVLCYKIKPQKVTGRKRGR